MSFMGLRAMQRLPGWMVCLRSAEAVAPDEIYNLSGQSSVALSFTQPAETLAGITLGTLNMLETLRRLRGKARF
jgi:GDPmannose 4,6-dehydratase